MQRLEVSGAVRPLYGSLGVKGLTIERKGRLTERNIDRKIRWKWGVLCLPGTTLHCYNGAFRKVCFSEGSQAVPARPSAKDITD